MNVTLGSGKAVHAGDSAPGFVTVPECGGNRAAERFRETSEDVTCKRCLKILATRATDTDRTAYYAGVAETQDDVMSHAQPVELERVSTDITATTEDGDRIVYASVPNGDPERVALFIAEAQSWGTLADVKAEPTPVPDAREDYDTYARWAVGPVMTREEYAAKGEAIKAQQTAGTLSTNPYEWGKDMDAVRAGLHTVEPTPEPCLSYSVPEHVRSNGDRFAKGVRVHIDNHPSIAGTVQSCYMSGEADGVRWPMVTIRWDREDRDRSAMISGLIPSTSTAESIRPCGPCGERYRLGDDGQPVPAAYTASFGGVVHAYLCESCADASLATSTATIERITTPVDVLSDAMAETSPDDAPYGPWEGPCVDRETAERALYHDDGDGFSTGRTAADGYDFPVTVTVRGPIKSGQHRVNSLVPAARKADPAPAWRVVDETTGEEVTLPTTRPDFRGNMGTVTGIADFPSPGKGGKVYYNGFGRVCYPGVYGLKIVAADNS